MPTYTTNFNLAKPLVNDPTDADVWGVELNSNFDSLDTLLRVITNSNISTSAPTSPTPQAGQIWIDNTTSTAWNVQIYDGTSWVSTGTLNSSTHTFTPANIPSPTGGILNVQAFTSSGTYTKTTGTTKALVICTGGGGGGAHAGTSAGSGGSAGGTAILWLTSGLGATETVTIGAGGSGGQALAGGSSTLPVAGGASSFGSHCSATGGGAGNGIYSTAGGTGSGGLINLTGGAGGTPSATYNASSSITGGMGGTTIWGGAGGGKAQGTAQYGPVLDATGYGAGGGGGTGAVGQYSGSAGKSGIVVVFEYT